MHRCNQMTWAGVVSASGRRGGAEEWAFGPGDVSWGVRSGAYCLTTIKTSYQATYPQWRCVVMPSNLCLVYLLNHLHSQTLCFLKSSLPHRTHIPPIVFASLVSYCVIYYFLYFPFFKKSHLHISTLSFWFSICSVIIFLMLSFLILCLSF